MKKWLCMLLCLAMLAAVPVMAMADSSYSTVSNTGVELQYPEDDSYYDTPLLATVKASRQNGSIYFMPTPKDGNGVLGTVSNGTEVTVLAEKSGYYFFATADGRMGWNGGKFFTFHGQTNAASNSERATAVGSSILFSFENGAQLVLPGSFAGGEGYGDSTSSVSYSFYDVRQSMDLILTETIAESAGLSGKALLDQMYASVQENYPYSTYDSQKSDRFTLSGYSGSEIYYVEAHLVDGVVYAMEMYYPIKNRSVCDRYVESICESFSAGVSTVSGTADGETIVLYHMVHYGTQEAEDPYCRVFRNYSINGDYKAYGARKSYGEKHFTRIVTEEDLANAQQFEPGVLVKGLLDNYMGYQYGTTTAYYFGDDKYVWFIESQEIVPVSSFSRTPSLFAKG